MSNLAEVGALSGALTVNSTLSGSLSDAGVLEGTVSQFQGNYSVYTGEYEVTPDFSEQTLQTKNRRMAGDITVKSIQVESVSNASGGRTVYIGGIS